MYDARRNRTIRTDDEDRMNIRQNGRIEFTARGGMVETTVGKSGG